MGQEASTPIDENIPAQTLERRDLASVAKFLKDGEHKRVVVMV
jgi:hypothetical protein